MYLMEMKRLREGTGCMLPYPGLLGSLIAADMRLPLKPEFMAKLGTVHGESLLPVLLAIIIYFNSVIYSFMDQPSSESWWWLMTVFCVRQTGSFTSLLVVIFLIINASGTSTAGWHRATVLLGFHYHISKMTYFVTGGTICRLAPVYFLIFCLLSTIHKLLLHSTMWNVVCVTGIRLCVIQMV